MTAHEASVVAWIGFGVFAFLVGYLVSYLPGIAPRAVDWKQATGVAVVSGATVGFNLSFWLFFGDTGFAGKVSMAIFVLLATFSMLFVVAILWLRYFGK
ncbi:MAG: hypothetical protein AAF184_12185 [Pseudomonadota bacterium]